MTTPTTDELYLQIVAAKNSFASLGGFTPHDDSIQAILDAFNNESQAEPWRIWAWLFAKQARLNYEAFALHLQEVNELISGENGINRAWLIRRAKEFEYGNTTLTIPDKGEAFYSFSDPATRIITVASVQRIRRVTLLLVAKGELGSYEKLSGSELAGLTSYIKEIEPTGGVIAVDSRDADELAFDLKVYYKGTAREDVMRPLVEAAIKAYLGNLNFAGFFETQHFFDAIQNVTLGPIPELDSIRIRKAGTGNQYVDFTTERGYSSHAGWMKWNEGDSNLTLIGV